MLKLIEIGRWQRSGVLIALGLMLGQFAIAQVPVKGTVTDKSGQPLVGVSISQKGTSVGTTSDASGNYSITAKDSFLVM